MKWRWLFPIILLTFAGTFVWQFPLQKVAHFWPVMNQYGALSGKLAQGHWQPGGQIQLPLLEQAQWRLSTKPLLKGRLGADVVLSGEGLSAQGLASASLASVLHLQDWRAELSAPTLTQVLGIPIVRLLGEFALELDSAQVDQQGPIALEGQLFWRAARVEGTVPVSLGEVRIALTGQARNMHATLSNENGELSVSGQISLDEQKNYQLDLSITPNAGVHPDVINALQFIANRNADGSYQMQDSGALSDLL